jgi:hypothetical protein
MEILRTTSGADGRRRVGPAAVSAPVGPGALAAFLTGRVDQI